MSSSLEMNKIVAAVLAAGVVAMTAGFVAELAIHPKHPEQHAYAVAMPEGEAAAAEEAGPMLEPVLPMLAAADVAAGEKVAKKCSACHTFEEGGANKIGPNLWNTVNRPIASAAGFGYSKMLESMAGEAWSYQSLNAFLATPKGFAPGTKMTFAGLKKASDRADLIAYMRSMSGAPAAMPSQEEIDAVMGGGDDKAEAPARESDAGSSTLASAEPAQDPDDPAASAEASEAAAGPDSPDDPDAASSGTQVAAADAGPIGARLAAADPATGEMIAKSCKVCHTFEKGGKKKIGPNLYNVVGAQIARNQGYKYSPALEGKSAESWSYENLDAWLTKPRDFAKGNKMVFPGLKKPDERAAVIVYMRQQNDNPPPLPQ